MANHDRDFAQAALAHNYITREQAGEGLKLLATMREMGLQETLGDVLIKKGYMNRAQVDAVTKALNQPRLTHIGRYRLIERVGQGGMGTVYKARQESLDKIVAVKVLSPRLARQKDFVRRFIREAQACGRLNHTNIVLGIDAGESDGYYYFAMEFVDGESLKDVLIRDGKLPEKRALEITRAMASALEHAHEQNIVHRDIKPGNIFLTSDGQPKLGDLGLAKEIQTDKSITQTGAPVGTPYYISPEQVRGEQHVDQRADLYALGATLYHMVAGAVPYDGPTGAVVMTRHLNDPIPDPRQQTHSLSEGTIEVINHAMAKDPSERYRNARQLREDIEDVLAGRPPGHAVKTKTYAASREARLAERKAQAEAKKKLLLYGVVGAVAVALIAIVLALSLGGGKEPEPKVEAPKPPPVAAPAPKQDPVKPKGTPKGTTQEEPVPPKVDPDALLRELLVDATLDSDPAATQKRIQAFIHAHPGTAASKKARARLTALTGHWQALADLEAKVTALTEAKEYAAALGLLAKPPFGEQSTRADELVARLTASVKQGAAEHIQAEKDRAGALARKGDLDGARAAYKGLLALKLPDAIAASDAGRQAVAALEAARAQREAQRAFAATFLEAAKLIADGKLSDARKLLDPAAQKGRPELMTLLKAAQADLDRLDVLFKTIEDDLTRRADQGGQVRIRGIMRPVTSVENHTITCRIGRAETQFDVYSLTVRDIEELECVKSALHMPLLELYRGNIEEAETELAKLPKAEAAPYLQMIRWVKSIGREGEAEDLLAETRTLVGQKNWTAAGEKVNRLLETYGDTGTVEKQRAAINDLSSRIADAIAEVRRQAETIRPFIDAADQCPALVKVLKTREVAGGWMMDIDNDGRLDIALDLRRGVGDTPYVPIFRNMTSAKTGKVAFVDMTREAGLDTGDEPICWTDLDGDSDLDVVCRGLWGAGRKSDHTKISLYENLGRGSEPMFRCHPDRSLEAELGKVAGFNGGFGNIGVLDANGDGRADILAQWYSQRRTLALFLSDGRKPFSFGDGSRRAGFYSSAGAKTVTPDLYHATAYPQYVVFDADGDHRTDFIFNADDGRIILNRAGGRFVPLEAETFKYNTNVVEQSPQVIPAIADYDNDGDMDIFVPQPGKNLLFRNDGASKFVDAMHTTGPMAMDAANSLWATWGDVNNDGLLDLFICNEGERNRLYIQKGNHAFVDKAEEFGVTGSKAGKTRFAAFGDFDRDGDLDMLILCDGGQSRLLLNPYIQKNNHFSLSVLLRARVGAIGAKVYLIKPPSTVIGMQQVGRVEGYNGQTPREAFFGVPAPGEYVVGVVLSSGRKSRHTVTVKATEPNFLIIKE